MGAFWAAAAYADVTFPAPLDEPGVVKGLLLRHMRWWALKPDIFNVDGTLNIGFLYPNMYMCEDYNSPQSVYWCMKSLLVVALPPDHTFWTSQELPRPSSALSLATKIEPPMQIVCDSGSHHFLLSSGQFCPWPLKATEAKYGKFAYSSHFGISVPTGPLIQQMALDSALALSLNEGESWYTRWKPLQPHFSTATFVSQGRTQEIPVLVSSWRPSRHGDFTVTTALIAPSSQWPDWHIRVHKFHTTSGQLLPPLTTVVEGGFAIPGRKASNGLPIPPMPLGDFTNMKDIQLPFEAVSTVAHGSLICSSAGASGIQDLRPSADTGQREGMLLASLPTPSILKPDANTNLMWPRTVIPTLTSLVPEEGNTGLRGALLITGVFAVATQRADLVERWRDPPKVYLGHEVGQPGESYISFKEW